MKQKYAFIDRDGTLIYEPEDNFQVDSLDKLKILNGAIEKLQDLQKKGYKLVMISNQDGLGTASFPKPDFEAPQNEMMRIFGEAGIKFDSVLVCPHFPEDNCDCRKPKTGLVKGWKDIGTDSIVVGDRESDMGFAKNLGIKGIKVESNKGVKP